MADLLYGRNAVREALRAGRRQARRLVLAAGSQEKSTVSEIITLAEKARLPIERVERRVLDRQVDSANQQNHQGVILETGAYPYVDMDDCLQAAQQRQEAALLLLLDHVQDPQNLGTLLRTAEAVGVHGVILPTRRAASITPAVVNTSSGATEHLNIASVSNLAQTMSSLQKAGVWVAGMEHAPDAVLFDQLPLDGPLALVVGAEGKGLARLTRERCDFVLRLPMRGHLGSLNAAVAGSIMLYDIWRSRTPSVPGA
jgi:23S rRNA (guanosine2251-2'-O)-methyltransferase